MNLNISAKQRPWFHRLPKRNRPFTNIRNNLFLFDKTNDSRHLSRSYFRRRVTISLRRSSRPFQLEERERNEKQRAIPADKAQVPPRLQRNDVDDIQQVYIHKRGRRRRARIESAGLAQMVQAPSKNRAAVCSQETRWAIAPVALFSFALQANNVVPSSMT